jgi:hypothetical protein
MDAHYRASISGNMIPEHLPSGRVVKPADILKDRRGDQRG